MPHRPEPRPDGPAAEIAGIRLPDMSGTRLPTGRPPRSIASMKPPPTAPDAGHEADRERARHPVVRDLPGGPRGPPARLRRRRSVDEDHPGLAARSSGRFLGSERGGIGLFSEDGELSRVPVRVLHARGAPRQLFGADLARALPWYAAELRAGRPVIVRARARGRSARGRGGARDRRGAGPPVDDRPAAHGRRRGARLRSAWTTTRGPATGPPSSSPASRCWPRSTRTPCTAGGRGPGCSGRPT